MLAQGVRGRSARAPPSGLERRRDRRAGRLSPRHDLEVARCWRPAGQATGERDRARRRRALVGPHRRPDRPAVAPVVDERVRDHPHRGLSRLLDYKYARAGGGRPVVSTRQPRCRPGVGESYRREHGPTRTAEGGAAPLLRRSLRRARVGCARCSASPKRVDSIEAITTSLRG